MMSSETNMMIAFLLRDGRYDKNASIMPVDLAMAISQGYEWHIDAQWVMETKFDVDVPERQYEAAIKQEKRQHQV